MSLPAPISSQSIEELIQSGKTIHQALYEIAHSSTEGECAILLHAPYDAPSENEDSVPIIAKGFRYGTVQQFTPLPDAQETMQQIAGICGNYLVHMEQMSFMRWRHATNLLIFPDLSPSERAVLTALYNGKETKDIAALLSLASQTVRIYYSHLYAKFQVKPVQSLIRRALDMGFFQYLSK